MIRVLIADDKIITLNGLKKLIPWSALNARVVGEATNGKEALDLAYSLEPDVLISDIRMPVMDGLELCKELHETMPGTVKIILTAYSDFTYAQKAIKYGVKDYIVKPIDEEKISQITDIIKSISRKYSLQTSYYRSMFKETLHERYLDILKSGNVEELKAFINNEIPDMSEVNYDVMREFCLSFFKVLFEYARSRSIDFDKLEISNEKVWEKLSLYKNSKSIKEYLLTLSKNFIILIDNQKNSRDESIAKYIKNCIDKNYHNPNFCINNIADELNLTPNYASAIFKRVYGESISKYITNVRLQHARELLRDPGIPVWKYPALKSNWRYQN